MSLDNKPNRRSSIKRRLFLKGATVASVTGITGLAGCSGIGEDEPYQVGSAQPLSGSLAQWGSEYNQYGMELALEDINDETIGGRELEFIVEDTESAPEAGVSAAQKLVNQDGVPVVMGAVSSGVSMAIAESVTIPNEVVQMINNSTTPATTELDDDMYVMRTAPNDAVQGLALGEVMYNAGVREASIIYINNDFGDAYTETTREAFEDLGGSVVAEVPYEEGRTDYNTQLREAMNAEPDGLAFIAYPEAFLPMARQAYQSGYKEDVQYIGAHPLVSDPMRNEIEPEMVNGITGTRPSVPADDSLYQEFESRYQDEYDLDPAPWSAYTYDAVNLIALAIASADEFESASIRDAIYEVSRPEGVEVRGFAEGQSELEDGNNINYQGVSGSVDLADNGDVPPVYQQWEFQDGEFIFGDFLSPEL